MNLFTVAARNAKRNKFRTALTILGGAVAVLAFVLLRTVLHAWNVGVDYAAKDRLATRNKVSIAIPLPKRYVEDVRAGVRGTKLVTYANWFGGKWPKDLDVFFANTAVADDYFDAFPEIAIPKEQRERYAADKRGAVVGDVLAKKLGIHLGDHITLTGTIYPGDWAFDVDAIYTTPPQSAVGRSNFYFHWSYLNDGIPPPRRDKIGWLTVVVGDASQGPAITSAIDRLFDERDMQTTTMSEQALNNGLLGGMSAILAAFGIVSLLILVIMTLILGNTIAMGVRERTAEYGVLRAIGFVPRQIRLFVLGEAATVSLLAALLGIGLSYPIVEVAMGKWFEENMGATFPYFHIDPATVLVALALTLGLGLLASVLPAMRAGRLVVTSALRRIG